MKRIDYNMKEHGFVGHLSLPQKETTYGVLVIMGGEQSLLPGKVIADKFADYGIMALAVSLFGAEGLPVGANQIPMDMFIPAVRVLRDKGCKSISTYGMSMGSIFAALVPKYIGVMPDRKREKKLYRLMPFIGIMYKSFGKYKADCLDALEQSEKEVVRWILH